MKKIFSLMVVAFFSLTMIAGENDLLWDFTGGAPSGSPVAADNNTNVKLYFNNKVNDAAGTNNGLKGIKLNSSGYCCFTKAAVAGKLKLSFGPRSGSNAANVEVWDWSMDGETPAKGTNHYATTEQQTEYGTQTIELTAEQNNIYLCRGVNTETALQKIQFIEDVARTFVDFEMIMCNMTEDYDFSTLPAGVTASGTFNTDQHGYRNFTITVPVDGTVRFTIGDCKYGNQPIIVKNSKSETVATLQYKQAGCYNNNDTDRDKVITYNYIGEAETLTFGPIQYCNYFKAEAAEITPCEIIFKDQNGAELGRVETFEGATLESIPYTVDNLPAIGDGNAFRGWFYTNAKKAKVGDPIDGNTTIQAKVTPIEVATVGSVQTYDFASQIFYPEDHETVEVTGGAFHDGTHGWIFNASGSIRVQVAGKALVVISLCKYSETSEITVKDEQENILSQAYLEKEQVPDGIETTAQYTGEAGWLTIGWTAQNYIHKVVVYNVLDFVEKDATTGYYLVPANDVASFRLALVQAQEGDKIFLPNGTYDLGETVLTTIGKNNISIIGQSTEGVIIKNAPDYRTESIDKTATIKINKNVSGTYLQDLTIQNALDYYHNDNGRAVALWDQGTKTVSKNVRLLSYQDTYYSNLVGAVKYFEDCEIHGTVDFICGDGSVYFKNNLLVAEQRKKDGGGSDALTASNADASDKGYVFEATTVRYAEGISGTKPVVSFGRAWNNSPKCVFLNTVLDDVNGELNMYKDASDQKDKIARWTLGAMNALPEKLGEYNSVNKSGNVVSPASNEVKFVLGANEKTMETILTADEAATYTMAYTLGNWAETAANDAKQAVAEKEAKDFEPNGIYLVEANGEFEAIILGSEFMDRFATYDGVNYTVRKANARGGFGQRAGEEPHEGIDNCACNTPAKKVVRDGQVIIVRDNKEYNVLGAQL